MAKPDSVGEVLVVADTTKRKRDAADVNLFSMCIAVAAAAAADDADAADFHGGRFNLRCMKIGRIVLWYQMWEFVAVFSISI
ncbi:MAG TPA: hypothetical protein PLJ65_07130 [Casimicrobium sp.]|mgnify:CR=1 FL=1|nr:hypothetical protein [Casimicrobium sp.]